MNPNDPEWCGHCGHVDLDRHVEQMSGDPVEQDDGTSIIPQVPALVLACPECGWAYRRELEDADPETESDMDHPDMSDTE